MLKEVLIVSGLSVAILAALLGSFTALIVCMPGHSHQGQLRPLSPGEILIKEGLETHVSTLASQIGARSWFHYDSLERARFYIRDQFLGMGLEVFEWPYEYKGEFFYNVEAIIPGETGSGADLVVGAHYDTVDDSPGANDNGSGVAGLLEIARALSGRSMKSSVRLVAFANEEPPFFNTMEGMGSIEYVRMIKKQKVLVKAMICLETIGYYTDEPTSQEYPPLIGLFYPKKGDFIAFVSNMKYRWLLKFVVNVFRERMDFPSEGIAAPSIVPGISWSDHRSFWQDDIPAIMVTDTAFYRDPAYHQISDTPDRLDYDRLARVVSGLSECVEVLANR